MVYTPQQTRPGGGCAATWPSNTLYYIHYFPTNCQNWNFVQLKTFSAHNRSENSHDVSRKRFNTHAEPHGTQAGRGHASELETLIIN